MFDKKLETLLLEPSEANLKTAAHIINQGGLVAFPTETVYGLGANALDEEAVDKVYKAKGRPSDNPMIVHVASLDDVKMVVKKIPEDAKLAMRAFWPGPLTIIFEADEKVPKVTTGGLSTVAVRMPDNDITLDLIREAGVPLVGPSANLSGKPSPTRYDHVMSDLGGKIHAVLQGGSCQVGIESTIVDLSGDEPMILRPGKITRSQLEEVLGKEVGLDPALDGSVDLEKEGISPKAPGMKYRHYAPNADMIIIEGERAKALAKIEELKAEHKELEEAGKIGVILFDDEDVLEAARDLFATLRQMDEDGIELILAVALKSEGVGFAVMNRMLKSAGGNVIRV